MVISTDYELLAIGLSADFKGHDGMGSKDQDVWSRLRGHDTIAFIIICLQHGPVQLKYSWYPHAGGWHKTLKWPLQSLLIQKHVPTAVTPVPGEPASCYTNYHIAGNIDGNYVWYL